MLEKVKGFVLVERDGDILTTEDRAEMMEHLEKKTTKRVYAYPGAMVESIESLEEEADAPCPVCVDRKRYA